MLQFPVPIIDVCHMAKNKSTLDTLQCYFHGRQSQLVSHTIIVVGQIRQVGGWVL
jgi:hypothetical protein